MTVIKDGIVVVVRHFLIVAMLQKWQYVTWKNGIFAPPLIDMMSSPATPM